MLEVTIATTPDSAAIHRWAEVFRAYDETNKRATAELLAKKGRDLGIKLFEGFRDVQFGGDPKRRGVAAAELAVRTSSGRGTKVRSALLARYQSARKDLGFSVRSFGQAGRYATTKAERAEARRDGRAARKRRADLWRKIVGAEIALRQSGIGVLAASFLMFRRSQRWSISQDSYVRTGAHDFIPNRTGRPLGSVQVTDDSMEIASYATGIGQVEQRYGIVDRALNASADDMLIYLRDRGALHLVAALQGQTAPAAT